VRIVIRNAQRHRLWLSCYFLAAGFFLAAFLVGRLRPPLPPPGSPEPLPNKTVDGNVMIVFSFVELSFGLLSIRQLDELFAVHLNVRPAQIDLISIRAPLLLKFLARDVGARRVTLR